MGKKLVVGPIRKGLTTNELAFNIDDDSFPTLINAYQWRGRVKRKRGTALLTHLSRYFNSLSTAYSSITTIPLAAVTGTGNLITGFAIQTNASIVPGTVTITVGMNVFTDPSKDGTLSPSGTINYATGDVAIVSQAGNSASAIFIYYPNLPAMGERDFITASSSFPGTIAFDTTYSYNIITAFPYSSYDVSFYKNPPSSGAYVQKTTVTPTSWNGEDYQQFWTVNYQGALWATNGITQPFSITNIGMQFAPASTISYVSSTSTTLTVSITNCPLIVGDFVFANEWNTGKGINWQTGYVTSASPNTPPLATKTLIITFPNATIGTSGLTPGILQYLTNRSNPVKDCIRWYDGDPTNGVINPPDLTGKLGWVNFMPPLSQGDYSIAKLPQDQYYLVGARMILPFKDRLLFIGPVVQTSTGLPIYIKDTVIYSQNGTPYYTASYTNMPTATVDTPTSATNQFTPLLVPINQTATSPAYFEDQTGFGGFTSAGLDQQINTAYPNEDVLIIGFDRTQTRFVARGDDINPFEFFLINSELGSGSTFSGIIMDQGVITKGSRGYVITSQVGTQRIDLQIPDEVFEVSLINNGTERVTSIRDYINEWIYITYLNNQSDSANYLFPNRSLFYNYRDESWAIFNECYTSYGSFRKQTGFIWSTAGLIYPSWDTWTDSWDSGQSTLLQPQVIAGNQQGYIIIKDIGEGESVSLNIQSFSGSTITCINHGLNLGDYLQITGCIGTIGALVNGNIYSVGQVISADTFVLAPTIGSGTYFGNGEIKRLYVPRIQTKQFPLAWDSARKTRIGPQQYLLTKTTKAQITLQIFLSQDATNPYNESPVYPSAKCTNNTLIYSSILYTCPESTNLGLTPTNINLNQLTGITQSQIWHRMNTSLLGDTVQLGFTLSDEQMRTVDINGNFISQQAEIELHGMILDVSPSQLLS